MFSCRYRQDVFHANRQEAHHEYRFRRRVRRRPHGRGGRRPSCRAAPPGHRGAEPGAQALHQGAHRAKRGRAAELPLPATAHRLPLPGRGAVHHPRLRQGPGAGRIQRHRHPPRRLPQVPAGTVASADGRFHRAGAGRPEPTGHPLSLRGRAGRRAGRLRGDRRRAGAGVPQHRPVRRFRRHRRRPLRMGTRRPGCRWRCSTLRGWTSPAPPGALHRQRLAPRAAVDPADQLPPLRRPVHPPRPDPPARGPALRAHGPAGQRDHRTRDGRRRGQRHRRRGGLAPLPDAGLPPDRRRWRRHHPGQHRGRPVQREEHHRPPGGFCVRIAG